MSYTMPRSGDRDARVHNGIFGKLPGSTPVPNSSDRDNGVPPIVLVTGSGDGCRVSLLGARLVDYLAGQGLRTGYMRLVGNDEEDSSQFQSSRASYVSDINDYGFPSTRSASPAELAQLFSLQIEEVCATAPDLIVATLCGAAWHHDARSALQAVRKLRTPTAAVLCALDGSTAMLGIETMQATGIPATAVWTPRSDGRILARERRLRMGDVRLCGRSELPAISRLLAVEMRRQWLPLDSALWSMGASATTPYAIVAA